MQAWGGVVGVTGHGVDGAPALRMADLASPWVAVPTLRLKRLRCPSQGFICYRCRSGVWRVYSIFPNLAELHLTFSLLPSPSPGLSGVR